MRIKTRSYEVVDLQSLSAQVDYFTQESLWGPNSALHLLSMEQFADNAAWMNTVSDLLDTWRKAGKDTVVFSQNPDAPERPVDQYFDVRGKMAQLFRSHSHGTAVSPPQWSGAMVIGIDDPLLIG